MATQDKNRGANASEISSQAVALAEQLGRIAGTIEGKAEKWMDRASLTDQLTAVRDRAAQLLESLAGGAARGPETAGKEGAQARATEAARPANRPANKGNSARASKGRPDPAHAPGKQHRKPGPSMHGVKHSDMRIPKARASAAARHRRKSFA
jgi:hypothetical protein